MGWQFAVPSSALHGFGAFCIFVAPSARNVGLYGWRTYIQSQSRKQLEQLVTPLLQQDAPRLVHFSPHWTGRVALTCAVTAFSCFLLQNALNMMETANGVAAIAELIGLGLTALETVLSPIVISRMEEAMEELDIDDSKRALGSFLKE